MSDELIHPFKPGDLLLHAGLTGDYYCLIISKEMERTIFQNYNGSVAGSVVSVIEYSLKKNTIEHYNYYTDIFREMSGHCPPEYK